MNDKTTVSISRETLQKLRLVSVLDGMSTTKWIEWVVNIAHESARINKNYGKPNKKTVA